MYLQVIAPPPPAPQPTALQKLFGVKPPAPPTPNPDAVAATTAAETSGQSQSTFLGLSGYRGMGCGGGKCSCGGKCKGMGLFDSGADVSGWGMGEWSIVGLSAIGLLAVASQTGKTVRRVKTGVRRRRARARRRAALQGELATL